MTLGVAGGEADSGSDGETKASSKIQYVMTRVIATGPEYAVEGQAFEVKLVDASHSPANDCVSIAIGDEVIPFWDSKTGETSELYDYDRENCALKIPASLVTAEHVKAGFKIIATSESGEYKVTPNFGSGVSYTGTVGDDAANFGSDYTITLSDSTGATSLLTKPVVKMCNGFTGEYKELSDSDYTYDATTGKLTIPGNKLTGDISIDVAEKAYGVSINGVALNGTNKKANLAGGEDTSKGSYEYDPVTNTLTLTGATIDTAIDSNCIKADGDLNIILVGENKIGEGFTGGYVIRVGGNLKISGEGSLDIAAGVVYADSNLTLDKVDISTKSGFRAFGGMKVEGGSLNVDFYDSNKYAFYIVGELSINGDVTLKTNNGYNCKGVEVGIFTIKEGNVILPCQVLGRASVNIEGGNSIIGNIDSSEGQTYEYGLTANNKSINFNGGDITVKGTVAAAFITNIDRAELNVADKMKIIAPVGAKKSGCVSGGFVERYFSSFSMDDSLTLDDSDKPTNACKEVTLSSTEHYGVYVDGIEITSNNISGNIDGLQDGANGSYAYDAETNTLTLTDVHLDGASNYDLRGNRAAIWSTGDLNLVLNGTNTSEYNGDLGTNSEEYLISVEGNLTISGTGSLTTSGTAGKLNGMRVAGDLIFDEATLNLVGESKVHNTVINSGTISLDNGDSTNHPDTYLSVEGDITVDDGVLAVVGENDNGSLNVTGFITINDGTVSTDSDMFGAAGVIINGGIVNAGSKSARFGISTLGDLTIAGGEVVAKGECGAIMLIAEYDHASDIGTLTLSNGVKVIRTNRDDGTYKTYDESIINEYHVNMGTYTVDDALEVDQNGGYPSNACIEVAFSAIEHYNVYVDGVELTEKNYEGNIDGLEDGSQGSYAYDVETKTLTLTDAVIDTVAEIPISVSASNKCAIYSKDDITIALVGESTVDTGVDEALSIFTKGNLVITSGEDGAEGTINCKDPEAIFTYGDFSIANATVNVDSGVISGGNTTIDGGSLNTGFISAEGDIYINGDVVATENRDDIGITSEGVVTIDGGNITSKYGIGGFTGIVINDGDINTGYYESLENEELSFVGLMSLGDIVINGGTIDATGYMAIIGKGNTDKSQDDEHDTALPKIVISDKLSVITSDGEDGALVDGYTEEDHTYIITFSAEDELEFLEGSFLAINACKRVKIAPKQFTVTFNMGEHGEAIDAQTVTIGGAVEKPEDPSADGYTFGGWYKDAACTTAWDFDTAVTEDITLYAKWTKKSSGGGSSSGGSSHSSSGGSSNQTTTTTTKNPDGSTTKVVESKDGSTVTTDKQVNGVTTEIKTDKNGDITDVSVKVPASVKDGAQAKIPADLGKQDGTVSAKVTYPDGTKETVKGTYENGVITIPVKKSAVIEILDDFIPLANRAFGDVPNDAYYADAVKWAVANGITSGTSDTTFSPLMNCSRGQVATFLYRAMGSPAVKNSGSFADVAAGTYYADAVQWAVENGITSGIGDGKFAPETTITRAQLVTLLWRMAGSPVPAGANNPFVDVKAESYYYNAVLWAVEQGITSGTGADTFSPDAACTRSQIVTFLWRYLGK